MLDRSLVLPHAVRQLSESRADEAAAVAVEGGALTWAQLSDDMLRWAGALGAVGVGASDTVATMLANTFDAYFAWLGAGWLRAIEVPVNTAYRGEMLRYVLDDSQARVAVVSQRYVERFADVAAVLERLELVIVPDADGPCAPIAGVRVLGLKAFLAGASAPGELGDGPSYRDVAAVIYTSGTTGPSKGVQVPWAELQQGPAAQPPGLLAPGDSYYSTYPTAHLTGKIALYTSALMDARLVLRDGFSVSGFWDDIRRFDVSACGVIGSMAALLMSAPERDDDADNPLDRMGMAPIIPAVETFKRRFGVSKVATGYGSTEVGWIFSSGWDPPDLRTCGRRRPDSPYEVMLVDEDDEPVAIGEIGELVVRANAPWTMNVGYWRKPEETARAWRNGWFHTGDAFREDADGWFHFVDRLKDALRRRGENISSFEVEAGIGAHPGVDEVAVVGVPSEQGEDEVKAVVVAVDRQAFDPAELIAWLVPRMPRFMIPRYVEVVDALPKTDGTLRVKKHLLRAGSLDGARVWDREREGIALPKA